MKKKLLTMTLAVLLPLGLLAGSGDVNGDGKINVADIVELQNYLNDNPSAKFNIDEADVNNDGKVDRADVKELVNVIFDGVEPYLKVSPKEVIVTNDQDPHEIVIHINTPDVVRDNLTVEFVELDADGNFTPFFPGWFQRKGWRDGDYVLDYDNNYSGIDYEDYLVIKNEEYHLSEMVKIIRKTSPNANLDYPDVMVVQLMDGTEDKFPLEGLGIQITPSFLRLMPENGTIEYPMENLNKVYFTYSNRE